MSSQQIDLRNQGMIRFADTVQSLAESLVMTRRQETAMQLRPSFHCQPQAVTERRISDFGKTVPQHFAKGTGMCEDALLHAATYFQSAFPAG
jgi:hypothetical protein